jgi:oligopeptide transport system permease protein
VGIAEIVALAIAFAALAATAWLPPRTLRVYAAVCIGGALVLGLRPLLGWQWALVAALVLSVVAGVRAPERILRRIAFALPSLVLLTFVTTLLMFLAPGSPFANERAAPPEVEQALRAQYGVPESPTAFFGVYVKRLVLEGTLGPAIKVQGRSVEDLLLPALPVSLSLGMLALLLAVVFGVALGVRAGLRPGSAADLSSMGLALVGISLPNFVIGALLIIVFSLALGWLPVAGWGGYPHLVMPVVTLALPYTAYIARLARGGTIDVMQQDFIRTARAKGMPERIVVMKHALRGAVLPVVSYLGPAAAGIMTGSFVVETLFGVPGMGQWFVKGAINRDYSVVLGTALVYFSLITVFNLVVDLTLGWVDPRVRDEL